MIYLNLNTMIKNIIMIKKFGSQEKFKNQMVKIIFKVKILNMHKPLIKWKSTKLIKFLKYKKKKFHKKQNQNSNHF